ncbi:hypothetical protein A9978_29960 [Pseudomonas sp. UMC65]|nr:hypothetical protein [Pseudomonas sp. UMC65]MBB1618525.1 hypothetical protein [Pseudomonas sp. UME65]
MAHPCVPTRRPVESVALEQITNILFRLAIKLEHNPVFLHILAVRVALSFDLDRPRLRHASSSAMHFLKAKEQSPALPPFIPVS